MQKYTLFLYGEQKFCKNFVTKQKISSQNRKFRHKIYAFRHNHSEIRHKIAIFVTKIGISSHFREISSQKFGKFKKIVIGCEIFKLIFLKKSENEVKKFHSPI